MTAKLKLSNVIENYSEFLQRISVNPNMSKIFNNGKPFNLHKFVEDLVNNFDELSVYFDYDNSELNTITAGLSRNSNIVLTSLKMALKDQKFDSNKPKNNNIPYSDETSTSWHFLPEVPDDDREVLICISGNQIPIQAYHLKNKWFGSIELRDSMNDNDCIDPTIYSDETLNNWSTKTCWCELPQFPNLDV